MPPRISVLVPCFNDGQFVGEAIASVEAQTFQDFEVIVVDDGSTDRATVDTLDACAGRRTRVLRTANRGLPAARNHAAAQATGEFLCALDADDRLAPTWFEKALRVLDERSDVAFVSHWLETFGDEQWAWTPARCDLPALLARNTVNGAALIRRDVFMAAGGYDEQMRGGCEDWDLWLRLVEHGWNGAIIPEVLFYYRRRPDSMSRMMIDEAAYRRPLEQLIDRHRAAYESHLVDVLVAKEAEAARLDEQITELERGALNVLRPSLDRAREEHAALSLKAFSAAAVRAREEEHEQLAWRASELAREVADLRASWSWWLTAPVRRLYEIVTRTGR